jgi:D-psicose/D-tagatose/L-ribulose 3-epimerase
MRLAISNIAWDVAEDDCVAAMLQRYGVDAVDIAPGKYFPHPDRATSSEIENVRRWWEGRGIEITGMQSLLFGTTGLNVFGLPATQEATLKRLGAVCRIGGLMGATRLVFGSPKNRDRSGLSDDEALEQATSFFRCLGDLAAAENVVVCLEPNPPCYGANFMTTSRDTADVVEAVGHPSIRMQLDVGAMAINEEAPADVVSSYAGLIGHVHASEPGLVPLGDGGARHDLVLPALMKYLPRAVVSIEMAATQNEPHLASIERALAFAIRSYRPNAGVC